MQLTFVVGTGRCGSTLVSRLFARHPDVLSMSEFFGIARLMSASGRPEEPFPAGDLDGAGLWSLLAGSFPMLDAMITDGLRTEEMCYPFGRGRYQPATGVPLISHYVLPLLGEDPDALFDELAAEVPSWPRRPAAAQYLALFGYLAGRLGRAVVVERSASSLRMIEAMHAQFPRARFVHLYRDGPDCALSMSRHPAFRRELLAAIALRNAGLPPEPASLPRANAALPERLRGMICPPYDAAKLMAYPIPAALFGQGVWSPQLVAGAAALGALPPGTWTQLRYEDLLRDPAGRLTALAGYAGAGAPEQWLDTARAMIDPARTGAAARLAPGERAALVAACEPGTAALRQLAGVTPLLVLMKLG
ncbi:MAG TPA: sulfotransferase [Streptosporangiaceae bacterium]